EGVGLQGRLRRHARPRVHPRGRRRGHRRRRRRPQGPQPRPGHRAGPHRGRHRPARHGLLQDHGRLPHRPPVTPAHTAPGGMTPDRTAPDRTAPGRAARDRAEMAALLAELVRVPSVGGSAAETEIQERLAAWMRAEGLEVDHWAVDLDRLAAEPGFPGMEAARSGAQGLVGRLPGTGGGRSLMLVCHVDVVPVGDASAWSEDPFGGRVADDRLYGRGACDMKGGLVAALFAVRALRRARLRGDVLVACVAGEEDGGLGAYALLDRGWRADACVIPEPTGLDVVPANAGSLTFRLRVRSPAAHAARRDAGVSAVERFLPVFTALRDLE